MAQGRARAPARAGARRDARELLRRAAPTTSGGRGRRTTSRASSPTTPTSPRRCRPAGTTASRTRHRVLRGDGGEEHGAAAARRRAVVARRDARRRDLHARRRLRRGVASGACSTTSSEQLEFFDRWLPDGATGAAGRRGAGADLRDGRRQRPQDRGRASSTTAGAGATSRSGRSRARVPTTWHLHGDGSLRGRGAGGRRRAAALHLRPRGSGADDRRQLLRGRRVPAAGRGDGADVDAAPQPGAAAAQHHDAGPRRPEGVGRVLHGARAVPAAVGARRTCSCTRPSRSSTSVEITGPRRGRALDRVVGGRHRLHGEADRRLPAERGLSRGLRHADQRLDHPHAATARASSAR